MYGWPAMQMSMAHTLFLTHTPSRAAAGASRAAWPTVSCRPCPTQSSCRHHACLLLQVLCIQGFLACRKHADRIILLVDMMSTSGCPAFKAGPRAIQALRKRFHLNLTEAQVRILLMASLVLPVCSPCQPVRLAPHLASPVEVFCLPFGEAVLPASHPLPYCLHQAPPHSSPWPAVCGSDAQSDQRQPGCMAHQTVRLLPASAQWHSLSSWPALCQLQI